VIGLVVEDRIEEGKDVCVRRKRVVELVIVRRKRLGKNQAEIRQNVVPPAFPLGANSVTLKEVSVGNRVAYCAAERFRTGIIKIPNTYIEAI
jgi:hypothetical protein